MTRTDLALTGAVAALFRNKAAELRALAETLADAEIRSKLIAAGLEPSYATGDAVLAQIEDELPRMRAIAQRAQIRAD